MDGATYGIVFRKQWDLRAETYFTTGGNKQCHIIFTPRFEMKYKYVGSTTMLLIEEHVQLLHAEFVNNQTIYTCWRNEQFLTRVDCKILFMICCVNYTNGVKLYHSGKVGSGRPFVRIFVRPKVLNGFQLN